MGHKESGEQFPEAWGSIFGIACCFEDEYAITIVDEESDPDEQRFISLGTGVKGRVLVVVYSYRGKNIRIISARLAETHECSEYEESR